MARSNHFLMDTTYLLNIAHTSVAYHCIGGSMGYQNTYPKVFQLEDYITKCVVSHKPTLIGSLGLP